MFDGVSCSPLMVDDSWWCFTMLFHGGFHHGTWSFKSSETRDGMIKHSRNSIKNTLGLPHSESTSFQCYVSAKMYHVDAYYLYIYNKLLPYIYIILYTVYIYTVIYVWMGFWPKNSGFSQIAFLYAENDCLNTSNAGVLLSDKTHEKKLVVNASPVQAGRCSLEKAGDFM